MTVERGFGHLGMDGEEYSLDYWMFSSEDQGVKVPSDTDFSYTHEIDDEAVYVVGRLLDEDLGEDEYRQRVKDSRLEGTVQEVIEDQFSLLYEGSSSLMFED